VEALAHFMDKLERENRFIIVTAHVKAYAVILMLGVPAETGSCGLFPVGIITDPGGFYPGFPGSYPEVVIIFFMYPGENAHLSLVIRYELVQAIRSCISFSIITTDISSKLFNEIFILFNEFHFPGGYFYRHGGILSGKSGQVWDGGETGTGKRIWAGS
jgi:hypothetical protein